MIADTSINKPFGEQLGNGVAPVLTTTSHLWVLRAGEALRAKHFAALMGINRADDRLMDVWASRLGGSRGQLRRDLAGNIDAVSKSGHRLELARAYVLAWARRERPG